MSHTVSVSDQSTLPSTLEIHNLSARALNLEWVDYNGDEKRYATLEPEDCFCQATYNTHPWRMRDAASGEKIFEYVGDAATIVINPDSTVTVSEPSSAGTWQKPEWGKYRQRGCAQGIAVMAYDCCSDAAVQQAELLIHRMLQAAPAAVLQRLQQAQCQVAIIGSHQVTSDIPAHHFMRHCKGRDIDGTTRGLGGTCAVPVTSCGEENLTMLDDRRYPSENILVHELGHTVMNVGLSAEERQHICKLYKQAKQQGLYDPGIYMMANEEEYWAEACQSWFDATVRCDVNDGINSREKLQQHDPGLATALVAAFGDNPWRYPMDAAGMLQERCKAQRPALDGSAECRSSGGARAAHAAVTMELAVPGAQGMDRSREAQGQREGCMHGAEHCAAGCMAGPRLLWAGLVRPWRSDR